MTNKEKITDLLSSQPLYKKVLVDTDFLKNPANLTDLPFTFYCPMDKSHQTFKLQIEPKNVLRIAGEKMTFDQYCESFHAFDQKEMKYKFTQHYSAKCQLCEKFTAHFMLHVETEKAIPVSLIRGQKNETPLQIVRKIGQYPPFQINPEKTLMNFLNDEDQENYRKALICRSQDYGIGAFAYLRRIIENEIIRIIEDLSKIDREESMKINALLSDFRVNHIMTNLIEGIYEYLPGSLKNLGNNPIKVLYSQLSGGIHEFSEDECSRKADQIDTLLRFVIKKISEESSEVKAVREALKNIGK